MSSDRQPRTEVEPVRDEAVGRVTLPEPSGGIYSADPIADRVDELLRDFGT
jgi:hypothetical protein